MDEDSSGALSLEEFGSAIKTFQIDVPEIDIKNAFKAFDLNNNGTVEYDEFIKVIIGPMSQNRLAYVEKAFNKLDINQIGLVDVTFNS